jgi:hypothetical protein
MAGLGYLPGGTNESIAYDVSADGSVVVGESGFGRTAFIWTANGGIRDLREVLLASGVTEVADWELNAAYGVSADGRTVVGIGTNPNRLAEAWLATIPEPASSWLLAAAALLLGATARWRNSRQTVPLFASRRGSTALVGLFAAIGIHLVAPANAQVVTFQFAGVIDDSASNLVDPGDPFTGTFEYDLNHSDINVEDPTRGEYLDFLWPTGLTWTAGPFFFDGPWSHITIFDTEVDSLTYRGTDFESGQRGSVHLADPMGAVFENDHLPVALHLADFADRRFEGRGVDEDFGIHNFSGHIDTLQLVSISNPGDYNHNGTVDAADYVVWRTSEGTMNSLPNDGGLSGPIDEDHYNLWRANLGRTAGSGAGAESPNSAVPEPATLTLLLFAALSTCARPQRMSWSDFHCA